MSNSKSNVATASILANVVAVIEVAASTITIIPTATLPLVSVVVMMSLQQQQKK